MDNGVGLVEECAETGCDQLTNRAYYLSLSFLFFYSSFYGIRSMGSAVVDPRDWFDLVCSVKEKVGWLVGLMD